MRMNGSGYPQPQFKREQYICLNGTWEFEEGNAVFKEKLDRVIEVPFSPESVLSGIGKTDFLTECTYARTIEILPEDIRERLVLHFGAVDYAAEVFVNGCFVCRHEGGYTPFEADIAPFVHTGKNRIAVYVRDDVRENAPSGKQSAKRESYGCFYTRTTGIWQTVWLEKTPKKYIRSVRFFPDVEKAELKAELTVEGGGKAKISVYYDGREVGSAEEEIYYRHTFEIALTEKHLWEVGQGRLYTVMLAFENDRVESYFGLREIRLDGRKFLLNGKSVFQRLVLDQGFYPDGIYTLPSEGAAERDIRLAMELGFNFGNTDSVSVKADST